MEVQATYTAEALQISGGAPVSTSSSTTKDKAKNMFSNWGREIKSKSQQVESYMFPDSPEKMFDNFNISDRILADYPCHALNGTGNVIKGNLFVTFNYLCFYSASTKKNLLYKIVIPLKDIVNMVQAVTVQSKNIKVPSIILPNELNVKLDVIRLINNQGVMHQFFNLGFPYERAWNVIWHAWKYVQMSSTDTIPSTAPAINPPTMTSYQQTSVPHYPDTYGQL